MPYEIKCHLPPNTSECTKPQCQPDRTTLEERKAELTLVSAIQCKQRWFTHLQTVFYPSNNHLTATRLEVKPIISRSALNCHTHFTYLLT